ncbi:MAG TPA: winged helix-turn-helix domain-containing protein [Pyrinomonadaceae bacterium]|jgi:Tol biopolymer transport system component/DNA-binding winged helix-turn-helix (wHTH) protein|nr:winged helix-turn-helix domain-containing protein [Pyrinomonadaceae bacterium]
MAAVRKTGNTLVYEFDDFRLDPEGRRLFRGGETVPLYGKAFEMLRVLVENRGRLLTKDELFNLVWPDQIVEESNLTVNMSTIRKALGERAGSPRLITTVSGRGYRFTSDVRELQGEASDELTFESETFTRVVVEEEDVEPALEGTPNSNRATFPKRMDHDAVLLPATLRSTVVSSEKRVKALAVALLAVLMVAVISGGVWLYQTRGRNNKNLMPGNAGLRTPLVTRRFDTHGGIPFYVAISPDGKTLAYIQRLQGKYSLWVGQVDTNSSVPIYDKPGISFSPTFSPDGTNIYFIVGGENRPQATLARLPVLGGALTELIPNVDSSITFSPDGKQLAFLRRAGGQTSLIVADAADGKNERVLTTRKPPENFSSTGLSWSPDGKSIAFGAAVASGRNELMAITVNDGNVNKIGHRDWGTVENVAWLPDGSGILAMVKENAGERRLEIYLVPYPEGEERVITNDLNVFLQNNLSVSADGKVAVLQGVINADIWVAPNGNASAAQRVLQGVAPRYEGIDGLTWTPDGRILYTAYVADSNTIWSMNGDGTDLKQLTPSKPNAFDREIAATSDGRYVVFQSNRSGDSEIWRVNSDGSNLKQLTTGGDNSLPSVSPDGRWILYTSVRDRKRTLWRISIDGTDAKQLTDKPSAWPQVSPDGKYIAYTVTSESPGVSLIVIPFEGGEPVKMFVVPETALRGRHAMRWTPDGQAILYKDAVKGLWKQELSEENAQPVQGFEELTLRQLAWSFDGKKLAYTTGVTTQEIILMENFK